MMVGMLILTHLHVHLHLFYTRACTFSEISAWGILSSLLLEYVAIRNYGTIMAIANFVRLYN